MIIKLKTDVTLHHGDGTKFVAKAGRFGNWSSSRDAQGNWHHVLYVQDPGRHRTAKLETYGANARPDYI